MPNVGPLGNIVTTGAQTQVGNLGNVVNTSLQQTTVGGGPVLPPKLYDHGQLAGLADDDHPQYLRKIEASTILSGLSSLTLGGNLNIGADGNVYSSGTVYIFGGDNISISTNNNTVYIIGASFSQSVQTQGTFNTTQLNEYQLSSLMSNYLTTQTSATFSNSNNVTFGVNNGVVTASASFAGGANDGINRISAGTQLAGTLATVVFSNANNVSFGMNNSSIITASASFNQSVQTQGTFDSNNLTNYQQTSGMSLYQPVSLMTDYLGTNYTTHTHSNYLNTSQSSLFQLTADNTLSLGTEYTTHTHSQYINTSVSSNFLTTQTAFVLSNSNGISFGTNGSTVTASYTVPNVPTQTSLVFSNSNNVTFGINASTLTASASFNQSVQTQNLVSINGSTGNVSFSNANGITFGANNSTITASHNALTSQSNQAFSASGSSSTFQTIQFGNTNGVSFSISNGSVVATVRTDYQSSNANYLTSQSVQTQNLHNVTLSGNTAGVMAQVSSGTLTLAGGNNITLSQNGNAITISGPTVGGAQTGISGISAGTTVMTSGTAIFSNSNGVSFGVNGNTITASHNGLTSQSNPALSGSNGSFTFQTATFGNSNGFSFYTTNGSLVGSYTVPSQTVQPGIQSIQVSNTTYTTGNVIFSNANGISFGSSAGGAITASYTVPSQTVQTQNLVSIQGSTGPISFSNANGITFGFNASTITASHNGLTTARASTDAIGLNTAQSNVTWTVNSSGLSLDARGYAGTGTSATNASITLNSNGLQISVAAPGGGVTPVASASNGSFSFTTLAFSNANNVTFGTSAGSIITASVAAPGAAAENNWFNLLGANTAGNTTASGSTIGMSGINLTLSGTNGSAINISAPATSSLSGTGRVSISVNANTISIGVPDEEVRSVYNPYGDLVYVVGGIGNGTLIINPNVIPAVTFDRLLFPIHVSNASNSSGSQTLSLWFGLYTRNTSTLP